MAINKTLLQDAGPSHIYIYILKKMTGHFSLMHLLQPLAATWRFAQSDDDDDVI